MENTKTNLVIVLDAGDEATKNLLSSPLLAEYTFKILHNEDELSACIVDGKLSDTYNNTLYCCQPLDQLETVLIARVAEKNGISLSSIFHLENPDSAGS